MTRSELMGRIRSRGNASMELVMAHFLRRNGVDGWRRHLRVKGIDVDFVFPALKLALFVDGCFWHWCPEHCDLVKLNDYWGCKIIGNWGRDVRQTRLLKAAGCRVVRIWEHSLKEEK